MAGLVNAQCVERGFHQHEDLEEEYGLQVGVAGLVRMVMAFNWWMHRGNGQLGCFY